MTDRLDRLEAAVQAHGEMLEVLVGEYALPGRLLDKWRAALAALREPERAPGPGVAEVERFMRSMDEVAPARPLPPLTDAALRLACEEYADASNGQRPHRDGIFAAISAYRAACAKGEA